MNEVSIVIPAYNEEGNINLLYSALKRAIERSGIIKNYEIIFVDDGSTDKMHYKLHSLKDDRLKIIKLNKSTGLSNALKTGFEAARNDIIVTIDADLQSDPSDIPGMLKKLEEGYDCVCGWRYERKDPFIKRISSKVANFVRRIVLKDNFRDITCPLKVFRKECIKNIKLFNGFHRFFPFLLQRKGYKIIEYKVKHYPRRFGKSKYGIRGRMIKAVADLFYVKFGSF